MALPIAEGATANAGVPHRRGYLDWLRGVGVLIMIEAHTLDSWTRIADRPRPSYRWAIVVGGFGAPIFLFLAGVAMALAANSRMRRGMSDDEAGRRAMRRAWQVFAFAFLFRLQSVVISGGGLRSFLKVDILNVMGVSMLIAALLWRIAGSTSRRFWLMTVATLVAAMLTPPIRSTPLLDWLPNAVEGYLRPEPGRSTFTVFPWAGFLFGGVLAGLWLDSSSPWTERRRILWLFAAGAMVTIAGYSASYLPPLYQQTSFWTSSPTFFFVRLGIMAGLVGVAFVWGQVWGDRWSPVRELGIASLFVYWIHVEMVYGVVSTPLHRALTFEQAVAAMAAFAVALYGLVRLKQRLSRLHIVDEKSTKIGSFHAPAASDRTQSG
jgi:uncharacterized membrane protein